MTNMLFLLKIPIYFALVKGFPAGGAAAGFWLFRPVHFILLSSLNFSVCIRRAINIFGICAFSAFQM
jgi:hypothetical protein